MEGRPTPKIGTIETTPEDALINGSIPPAPDGVDVKEWEHGVRSQRELAMQDWAEGTHGKLPRDVSNAWNSYISAVEEMPSMLIMLGGHIAPFEDYVQTKYANDPLTSEYILKQSDASAVAEFDRIAESFNKALAQYIEAAEESSSKEDVLNVMLSLCKEMRALIPLQ